jgi:long-chain fatty acid transport protein
LQTCASCKIFCHAAGLDPGASHGRRFLYLEQSPKATGRAYSGEVADTGPESLWWNPAAIAGQGRPAASAPAPSCPGQDEQYQHDHRAPGPKPGPVGGDQVSSNPINNGVVPTGAIAYGLNDKVALGLAITAPYNFTTEYSTNSWARYSALPRADDHRHPARHRHRGNPRPASGRCGQYRAGQAELSNALPNLSPLLPDGSQI